MNRNHGDSFVPPNGQNYQQNFNPYGSYASSNTFYDPAFVPPSKQSSLGHGSSPDHHQLESPYSVNSHHPLDPRTAPASGYSSKPTYIPGGYAQGPPGNRSPSPTPSELEEMNRGVIDWKKILNWRTYAKKKYILWFIVLVIILVLVGLMTIYHKEIVQWLKPVATWMKSFSLGWLIPIGVLFVISFPPLFGHEIVGILVGLVWGLWVGFAIVVAGTLLGEIGNFYAFKYCCLARGEKMEKQRLSYACLARAVREGGFKIALIARLSAIPGHFTTAIFATCGMGIFTFTLAALLSMPKQFITVYLGVILEQSADTAEQQAADNNSRIISDSVLVVTFLITVAAGWYIWREMNRVKPAVVRERRLAKKKLAGPSVETAYLSRPSNLDVSSEEDMMSPVKHNEPRMGGYGYSGYGGHASYSTDTVEAPVPHRLHAAGGEQWAMSERRTDGYPPPQPQQYRRHESENTEWNQHRQSPASSSQHQPPPFIQNVPNLTGPRRAGREGWETSDATTVGMGSWGGILKEGSEPQQQRHRQQPSSEDHSPETPRAGAYQTHQTQPYQQPYQQQQQQQHRTGPDEYGRGGGLSALGAPMGGGDTVMVTPKNVPGGVARQSREMPGHAAGRSMRAVVEGYGGDHHEDDDASLAYLSSSSPPPETGRRGYTLRDPGSLQQQQQPSESSVESGGGHRQHVYEGRDASAGTFGAGGERSLHSREFATSGTSDDRDEQFAPPSAMNRR